jgi:Ca2+-binding EF-hand superfamily protein
MLVDIFEDVDVDGDNKLTTEEFHNALLGLGVHHPLEATKAAVNELDMDGDESISPAELSAQLAAYRRKRRTLVAKVFKQCFEFIQKSGQTASQIFSRVDTDGSGELDLLEFQESMRRMGQNLTPNQACEVMAELDLDSTYSV